MQINKLNSNFSYILKYVTTFCFIQLPFRMFGQYDYLNKIEKEFEAIVRQKNSKLLEK